MNETPSSDGTNRLFRDSKLGLAVTGVGTLVVDAILTGVLDAATSVDTSGWSGWWTTVASAALATAVGVVTAYKAKRDKARARTTY